MEVYIFVESGKNRPAIKLTRFRSLPGAIGMFALSLGVQRISSILPGAAYALLSGLNASTVGIVALAAVQVPNQDISQWALTDMALAQRKSHQGQAIENPCHFWRVRRSLLQRSLVFSSAHHLGGNPDGGLGCLATTKGLSLEEEAEGKKVATANCG